MRVAACAFRGEHAPQGGLCFSREQIEQLQPAVPVPRRGRAPVPAARVVRERRRTLSGQQCAPGRGQEVGQGRAGFPFPSWLAWILDESSPLLFLVPLGSGGEFATRVTADTARVPACSGLTWSRPQRPALGGTLLSRPSPPPSHTRVAARPLCNAGPQRLPTSCALKVLSVQSGWAWSPLQVRGHVGVLYSPGPAGEPEHRRFARAAPCCVTCIW